MASDTPLSNNQVSHFKTFGFLILKNLLDHASIDHWRQQIWRELETSLETPETWTKRGGLDGYQYDPPESALVHHPALTPNYTTTPRRCIRPQRRYSYHKVAREKSWQMPKSGHIDAYGGRWLPFMIGATTYLFYTM